MSFGQIWLLPWADTRPLAGQTAYQVTISGSTYTGTWLAGIWSSWPRATYSNLYAISGRGPVCSAQARMSTADWVGVAPVPGSADSLALVSNSYLVDQGMHNTTTTYASGGQSVSVSISAFEGICPKRPLLSDPVCIDIEDCALAVTLTGITYRNTHSQRRHWAVELLLDGPLDAVGPSLVEAGRTWPDTRRFWQKFLKRAELGVTLILDTYSYALPACLAQNSWYSYVQLDHPYCTCPQLITGQITDCSTTRWDPGADGRMARFKVSMTIAEVLPPGAL